MRSGSRVGTSSTASGAPRHDAADADRVQGVLACSAQRPTSGPRRRRLLPARPARDRHPQELPESDRFIRACARGRLPSDGVPFRPERPTAPRRRSSGTSVGASACLVLAPLDLIAWLAFVTVGLSVVSALARIVLRFVDPSLAPRVRVAPRRDPLPRRSSSLPGHHRLVPRPHLRRGQAPGLVHRRKRPQRAGAPQLRHRGLGGEDAVPPPDGRGPSSRHGRHEAPESPHKW